MRSFFKKIWNFITHLQVMAVFLAFFLMMILSYRFMSGIERRHLLKDINNAMSSTNDYILSGLSEPETTLGVIAETIRGMLISGYNSDAIHEYIGYINNYIRSGGNRRMEGALGCYGIFDVFGGELMTGDDSWTPPEGLDIKSRPWYKAAVEAAGKTVFTQPYIDLYSNEISVSFSRRIFDKEGNPLGVIGLDVAISSIMDFAVNTYIPANSYWVLFDSDLKVISHPQISSLGKHLSQMNDGDALLDILLHGREVSERRAKDYNGNDSIIFMRRLDNGWYLAIISYSNIYYRSVREIGFIISLLGLTLAVSLSLILLSIIASKKKTEERVQIMLDATPLAANFWNSDFKNVECNQEAVKLFELSSKKEYLEKFLTFSPEYQPDGKLSSEKGVECLKKAFDEGYLCFEWLHRNNNGELIPCEVTLVRLVYRNENILCGYTRDLRELKSIMAKMREADECTQVLFDATPLGCFMVDNHFRILECNNDIVRLFDLYDKQVFLDRIGELLPEFQPSGDISTDKLIRYINETFDEGYRRFEWIFQKLNGEKIPTDIILVRVKYRGMYAVAGYIMDLRETKTMIGKIKEAEERVMMMLDATPLGITMWNEDLTLLDFNYEMARVVGIYSKQEYREKFVQTLPEYQPDGRKSMERLTEFIACAFKDGNAMMNWSHNTIDGEALFFEAIAVRLMYKDKPVVVVYCRDMRELNAAIAKIREADECTHVLFDATPLSCFMIDNANRILECNQEIVRMFGLSDKKEYIDGFFNFFPEYQSSGELSREKITKHIYEAFDEGYCNFEFIHQKPDGEQIPTEVSLVRVKYKGVYAVAGYIRDLRELKTMIAEMHRAEIAEESNKAKTEFLAKMSHEIRTPMNAILGITEIQLQDSTLSLVQREALERIYNSGDLLLGIINDILDLSKIEAGKLELSKIQYDIASLIHDIVKLNVIRYESKPIEIKLNVSEDIPTLLVGDELRIKQILNNLLSNAFKYTNEGQIELTFLTEDVSGNSLTLVIQVSDTGQGMTAEQLKKIGDKYSRFNMESNRSTEGTGLGMNITRNLIQLMNGKIQIESAVGVGSTFTVRLPQGCSDPSPIGKELAENLMKLNLKNTAKVRNLQIQQDYMPYGRVLVVDDVETNLYVARGLMSSYGLTIDTVLSGFDAIDKIRVGETYDIIFMDHMMPRMDGIETANIIRSIGYSQPIVALTANAISGQAEMFLNNGFDDFISKPIDIRQLNIVLNRFIRDKQPPEVIEEARLKKNYLYASGRHSLAVDPQLSEFFVRDAQKAAGLLKAIYENNCRRTDDISSFIINIHSMKSALANIGENELSEKAAKLEQAGRSQNVDVILSALPEFLASLYKVIDKLKPSEDDDIQENADADSADMDYLKEKLAIILNACESFDKKTAKDALSALKLKQWPKKIREQLSDITERLLHSEFDEAVSITKEISY